MMGSAIKKITGGLMALFLAFSLALSYPVQALELRFILPATKTPAAETKAPDFLNKKTLEVNLVLVVSPLINLPLILQFTLKKPNEKMLLENLQNQITKIQMDVNAKLLKKQQAQKINGLNSKVIVEAVKPSSQQEYALHVITDPKTQTFRLVYQCLGDLMCSIIDRITGIHIREASPNSQGEFILTIADIINLVGYAAILPVLQVGENLVAASNGGSIGIGSFSAGAAPTASLFGTVTFTCTAHAAIPGLINHQSCALTWTSGTATCGTCTYDMRRSDSVVIFTDRACPNTGLASCATDDTGNITDSVTIEARVCQSGTCSAYTTET